MPDSAHEIACSLCSKVRPAKPSKDGTPKLPRGWKRRDNLPVCDACWDRGFILRAVTFPVVGPMEPTTWPQLREALASAWADTTSAANWAVTELAKAETVRTPDMARMAAAPSLYLYPGCRAVVPRLNPQSITSLLRSVEQNYRKRRLDVVWRRSAALPTYQFPVPYPVHNQGWEARWLFEKERVPLVDVRIGGQRITLRLRGGPQMRRQLAAFEQIVSGAARQGELSLYRVRASTGDHRGGVEDRSPGGGQRVQYRIMCKMVAWMPRSVPGPREEVVRLSTGPEAFWTAVCGQRDPWVLHADHVRRWISEHRERLQALADDTKFEKRWPKRRRTQINEARERWCEKHQNRISTFLHEASAMLVGWAKRCRAATVEYDDTARSWAESFPWAALRERLRDKLDAEGISLVCQTESDAPPEVAEQIAGEAE